MICTDCLSKVDSWFDYRKTCRENQSKLIGWMNAWSTSNAGDISIHIKDEVVEDGDGPPPRQVNIDENGVIHIKTEPIAVCSDSEILDEDVYDMQPGTTDQLNFDSENEEEGECEMNAYTLTDGINGLASDVDPLEVSQNGEGSNCRICNKVFSTPGNRRKHEYMIHKHKDGSFSKNNESAVEVLDDEQNTWNTDESTTGSSSITGNETEIQKIQFAAGLQLQQRSTQQDESVPLTKVEVSYLDKCKTIVKMTETLVCACHGERFNDQKDLFIHLKKMRTWFAMFTCYNCLITFGDRSTYMKHFCSCTKPILENLKRLANTAINPKIKIRLYQSYKCIKCDCIFSFREDYNSHLDEEHLDAAEGPPYACVCSQSFDEIDEYKEHVHVSCFLRYFCDICFGAFTTVDAFRAHCEKRA
ncbi:hypothetical protein ILUMI_20842 [Ignelater luminosus]|uniref:C2H2-type domain-containing protein n=1 Tax=Ignelater luminosus TaxID=2038154 RepID=A0A8K0CK06_IGNLU|nr:hypothetical protein ILUMI_20842 [Ignelater luminosus]